MEIADIRRLHRLTRSQFAAEVGVSTTAVRNWERGRSEVSDDNRRKISRVFGVKLRAPEDPGKIRASDLILARKRAGLTRHELAELLDVSSATLSCWENKRRDIPPSRFDSLKDTLGLVPTKARSERDKIIHEEVRAVVDRSVAAAHAREAAVRETAVDEVEVAAVEEENVDRLSTLEALGLAVYLRVGHELNGTSLFSAMRFADVEDPSEFKRILRQEAKGAVGRSADVVLEILLDGKRA